MARYRIVKDGTAVLLHRAADVQTWAVCQRLYPNLKKVVREFAKEGFPTGKDLLRDSHMWFNKPAPVFGPHVPMKPTHVIHEPLLRGLVETPAFLEMRACGTADDEVASSIACIAVANAIKKALTPEQKDLMNELAQALKAAGADAQGKGEKGSPSDPAKGSEKGGAGEASGLAQVGQGTDVGVSNTRQSKEQEARAEAAREKVRELTEELLAQVDSMVQAVAHQLGKDTKAQGEVREQAAENHAFGGFGPEDIPDNLPTPKDSGNADPGEFGGYGDGTPEDGDPGNGAGTGPSFSESFLEHTVAQKFALAKVIGNNSLLSAVASFLGRVEMMATQEVVAKGAPVPEETIGIEQGRSLSRMIPSARMKLGHPLLAMMLARDVLEGSVDQYEMEGEESMGMGPLAIVCDSSGSMSGTPDQITKAITLALLRRAYQQRRDAMVVSFSGHNQTRVWTFPKGKVKQADAVEMAAHYFGGSTDMDGWLEVVTKAVKTARFAKADCVVVTDGAAYVRDENRRAWNLMRESRGMRSIGILIGHEGSEILTSLCDKVVAVDSITNERNQRAIVKELFQTL